jgi:hypothetical protein
VELGMSLDPPLVQQAVVVTLAHAAQAVSGGRNAAFPFNVAVTD